MKNIKVLFIMVLGTFLSAQAQQYCAVTTDALVVRSKPDANSIKIGILHIADVVEKLENTNISLEIVDNGKSVRGNWVKVKSNSIGVGYVFDGFLIEKMEARGNNNLQFDEEYPQHSKFTFEKFDVIIYNYQTQNDRRIKGDTIETFEWVFNEIGDKILKVIPTSPYDSIKVYHTRMESISEQYNYKLNGSIPWEEWSKNRVHWEGNSEFQGVDGKGNVFRVPLTNYEKQETFRKQQMNLRDTLIDLSGESWNVATMIYKEVPCNYGISRVVLKVVVYANGKKDIKYVDVILSYGC